MSENETSGRESLGPNGTTLLAGNTGRKPTEVPMLVEPNLDIGFRRNNNGSFSAVISLPPDRSQEVMPLLTVTGNYAGQLRDRVQNRLLEMGVPAVVEYNGKVRTEGGSTINPKIEGSVPIGPGTVGGGLDTKFENRSSIELGITIKPGFPPLDQDKQRALQEFFDSERRNIYRDWAEGKPNGTTLNYGRFDENGKPVIQNGKPVIDSSIQVGREDMQGYLNNPKYQPFEPRDSAEIWRNRNWGEWFGRPDPNPTTNPAMRNPNNTRSDALTPETQVSTAPTPTNRPENPANPSVPTPAQPTTATANPAAVDLSTGVYERLHGKIQQGVDNLPAPSNPDLSRVDNRALTTALTFEAAQRGFDADKEINVARGRGNNENQVFAINGPSQDPASLNARVDSTNLQMPTAQQIAQLPPPPSSDPPQIAQTQRQSGMSMG
jgi:hypothetical protein